jgi:hypothetical protein
MYNVVVLNAEVLLEVALAGRRRTTANIKASTNQTPCLLQCTLWSCVEVYAI